MMDMDLRSYVKIYNDMIEADKCIQTVNELKDCSWSQHYFYDSKDSSSKNISGEKELMVSYDIITNQSYIMQRIWDSYSKYITDLNFSWFSGWVGYTQVRYNKYNTGQLMALHCDHIHSMFDGERKGIPTLTALGCLNDNYEGGDLVMWDQTIKLKSGDIMVFPSVFLYPHKVEEVTKGDRYTFVSWAW